MSQVMHTSASNNVGLYDPRFEHDACGVGAVVDIKGKKSHEIVDRALSVLEHLAHRGASGAEEDSGDGAGILVQIPHRLYESFAQKEGIALAAAGTYLSGLVFHSAEAKEATRAEIDKIAASEGLVTHWWRDVPVDDSDLGDTARATLPLMSQVFFCATSEVESALALDRIGYVVRKRIEHEIDDCYLPSLSARTIVYKGMLTSHQLRRFFLDLNDPEFESALALVHSRFSTNTFPSWPLAHPYRYIAHNGEINTVSGNRNWMRAREALLESDLIPGDLSRLFPICTPGGSDSASFDEVLELLHLGGRSLAHSVLMMIPEAWENHQEMDSARRSFYHYHSALMEPWDGPAAVAFSDGTVIGAVLDRNGLRPARYWITDETVAILASEVGVVDIAADRVVKKGRLQPGKMFLVDTEQGRIIDDDEIKASLASEHPYAQWLARDQVRLSDLPQRSMLTPQHAGVVRHLQLFGYSNEDLRLILAPMATNGEEPIGSMGSDTALAALSQRPRMLFDYFHQLFAQVTNPPLDAIREELVTSLTATVGPAPNLLSAGSTSCRQISLPSPLIDRDDLAKLRYVNEHGENPGFKAAVLDMLFPVGADRESDHAEVLRHAIERLRHQADKEIEAGANVLILSDRLSDAENAPIPSLLGVAAIHHHLVRQKTRTQVGLVVEAGDAREVHHMALLIGYGAAAINPYMALDAIDDMIASGQIAGTNPRQARRYYLKAAAKGVLKTMSKMGISTVASYTGAQVFEALGIDNDVVDEYFAGTPSRLGGIGLDVIAGEVLARHRLAYLDRTSERAHRELEVGGEYVWRREGEFHLFNPKTVFKLQHATRAKRYEIFKEYSGAVDAQSEQVATIRGLLAFAPPSSGPIPIDEVESIESIMKRFSTGAMSYGSISAEAHETLAIAMNRLSARSNTGEGGEDAERFTPDPNGDSRRSAIKQVASGRFGVTAEYLVNADDIQIKIAQGAKPGEGGQLPGHKVYPWIARTRHSTPGVGLISPPPHHDIYSIEDIAQLIHDLKSANTRARVHVKLVSEVGVGTVAAGVAKAHADVVLISGHDGGTGAAPLTSLKHAGLPWEIGLAETQQTLMRNGLRDRIVVQVDGQLKTGRDVVIAALLGAEEFGFASAPLVVSGCIMMRVCHLDTCPVGIATQNPQLRARFSGKPEFVETFFEYIALEVREHLAALGLRSIDEAIGRVDLLDATRLSRTKKASALNLEPILARPENPYGSEPRAVRSQDHSLDKALDHHFFEVCNSALETGTPVSYRLPITNRDRSVATLLSAELTRRHGGKGLPPGTISLTFDGSAGQSFGAFVTRGITLRLEGDANDYVGKGLSGGRIVLVPPSGSTFAAEHQIIAGNVALYGATSGEAFIRGQVGERFCVRNSGATAVVEGVGDHACEYMTGGIAVVLGPIGRNFGAGMSGGVAYLRRSDETNLSRVNLDMVDLEPLSETDEAVLLDILRRYEKTTGSAIAAEILARETNLADEFVKVMPRDYRRVLEVMARAAAEGLDVDQAVMERSHG